MAKPKKKREDAIPPAELIGGLVTAGHGRHYVVTTDAGERLEAHRRGKKGDVVVGDRVGVTPPVSGVAAIERIEPRRNLLYRSDEWRIKSLAANVDLVAVVFAPRPTFNPWFIWKALLAAHQAGIPALVIRNKSDLADNAEAADAECARLTAIGHNVVAISAGNDPEGARRTLIPRFTGKTVLLVGQSGMGKSTLLNALVPHAQAATREFSEALDLGKQTTTAARLYRADMDDWEGAVVDTPGFQTKVGSQLIRRMNRQVRSTLNEVDAIVLVIESGGWRPADLEVVNLLPKDAKNVILALNKTDLLKGRDKLLPLMAESMQKFPFAAIVPVSAEKGRQCDELLKEIKAFLPESVPFFDPDTYTDRSPRFLAAETIREKAFRLLGDELPYGCAVTIDRWKEEDEAAEIIATLIVERESHKPIVIGEGGAKLREISRLARADIAAMLGKRLHLEVWVRVRRGWSDDARALKSLGYD